MDEILLVVPTVLGAIAVGAVVATGEIALVTLAPGLLALGLFALGMYVVARVRSPGQLPPPSNADGAPPEQLRADGQTPSQSSTTGPTRDGATEDSTPSAGAIEQARPLVRGAEEVSYEAVDAGDGMRKGVLVGAGDGATSLATRRFVLGPDARVPEHTNAVDHHQYVLEGQYTVGLGERELSVEPGDAIYIPQGTVHWYRNDGADQASFICAVPGGPDQIELVER